MRQPDFLITREAEGIFRAAATLRATTLDTERRTVEAVLATGQPVQIGPIRQRLTIAPGAIDLTRAAEGITLYDSHDPRSGQPAGRVGRVSDVRIEAGELVGRLHFKEGARGDEAMDDVRQSVVRHVSVGGRADPASISRDAAGDQVVGRWELLHVALAGDAADTSAVIRSADPQLDDSSNRGSGLDEFDVRRIVAPWRLESGVEALVTRALAESLTEAQIREELLRIIDGPRDRFTPTRPAAAPGLDIHLSEDVADRVARGVEEAIVLTVAPEVDIGISRSTDTRDEVPSLAAGINPHQNHFTGRSAIDLMRTLLQARNVPGVATMGADDVIARAIEPGTAQYTRASFPALLENVLNKAMFMGFDAARVSWPGWVGVDNNRDFKPFTRPGMSQMSDLQKVAENAEIQNLTRLDKKEGGTIETYAGKTSLTRQALIDDDLGGFASTAAAMGVSASVTLEKDCINELISNSYDGPAMVEQANLFARTAQATGVNNYLATGTAPSIDNVTAIKIAMSRQTDRNSQQLALRPSIMLVPIDLEDKAIELSGAEYDPRPNDTSAGVDTRINTVRNTFVPVTADRLPLAQPWWMLSGLGQSFRVAFLGGRREPVFRREEGWSVLSMHWSVHHDWDVFVVDPRGIYYNPGATRTHT